MIFRHGNEIFNEIFGPQKNSMDNWNDWNSLEVSKLLRVKDNLLSKTSLKPLYAHFVRILIFVTFQGILA